MDSKEIEKIAQLARLKLEEEEKIALTKDLSSILNYINQIENLDTTSIREEDLFHQSIKVMRKDIKNDTLERDAVKDFAPVYENGYIVVPRVIET